MSHSVLVGLCFCTQVAKLLSLSVVVHFLIVPTVQPVHCFPSSISPSQSSSFPLQSSSVGYSPASIKFRFPSLSHTYCVGLQFSPFGIVVCSPGVQSVFCISEHGTRDARKLTL